MNGEESFLDGSKPITDLCYFSAEINAYGELIGVPDVAKLSAIPARKHLVVAEISSSSLTHFCLDPAFQVRDRLVGEILSSAAPFDGVQIDFEAIPARDRENFIDFLRLLKLGLGSKTLSVALPARLSEAGDQLGYARVAAIVDRIIVMAYDEHWSASAPGPVASMDWCRRVAMYSASKIGTEKLVVGIPFYGRAWGDKKPNRAYKHSSIEALLAEKGATLSRDGGVPWFRYVETVLVDVYYDDAESLSLRMGVYKDIGVAAIAFWRLGQEDQRLWARITNE